MAAQGLGLHTGYRTFPDGLQLLPEEYLTPSYDRTKVFLCKEFVGEMKPQLDVKPFWASLDHLSDYLLDEHARQAIHQAMRFK